MTGRWRLASWLAAFSGALPLLACLPAPLTDWPNHIARVWIGVRLLHGDPFWARFYTLNSHIVPNLALDLGIGALNYAGLDVDLAAAIFLVISFAVFVGGFCRFAAAMGSDDGSKPMLGAILFLTGPLMYGLVNYVLGIGCALWAVSFWHSSGTNTARRWACAFGATLILFPVHLLGGAVFVAIAGCADAWTWRNALRLDGRSLLRASSSVGALFTFVILLLLSPTGGDSIPRIDGSNVWYPAHGQFIASLWWKGGIFVRMFADHATIPATALALIGLSVALACVLGGPRPAAPDAHRGPARSSAIDDDGVRAGAWLAATVFLAIVLVVPESLGTGSLLDYRLALVPLVIVAALIDGRTARPALARPAFAAVLVTCVGRSLSFAADFHAERPVFRSLDAAAARLPPGGIVLSSRGLADEQIPQRVWWSPPLEHGASRLVFARQFVPTIFAVASQQPVVLKPEFSQWRRSWRIADQSEIETFLRDAAPLCSPAGSWPGHVLLFVAYPGHFAEPTVSAGLDWAVLNACDMTAGQE